MTLVIRHSSTRHTLTLVEEGLSRTSVLCPPLTVLEFAVKPGSLTVIHRPFAMLTAYIRAAMRSAHYELTENARFFATIPACRGAWAEAATLEACRDELESTLEEWIMVKLRQGDEDFQVIDGVDLNPKPVYAEAD